MCVCVFVCVCVCGVLHCRDRPYFISGATHPPPVVSGGRKTRIVGVSIHVTNLLTPERRTDAVGILETADRSDLIA